MPKKKPKKKPARALAPPTGDTPAVATESAEVKALPLDLPPEIERGPITTLRRVALFRGTSQAFIEAMAECVSTRSTRRDERVVARGEPGHSVFIVHRGRFKVVASDANGRQITINVLGHAELFGELAIIDQGPRSADVISMGPGVLLSIERGAFLEHASDQAALAWRFAALVTRRLRRLTSYLEDRSFLEIEQRLAKRLVELAEDASSTTYGRVMPGTTVWMSQRELAEIVDASRERVNRQLTLWEREGVIALERGAIRVVQPDGLRSKAIFEG